MKFLVPYYSNLYMRIIVESTDPHRQTLVFLYLPTVLTLNFTGLP